MPRRLLVLLALFVMAVACQLVGACSYHPGLSGGPEADIKELTGGRVSLEGLKRYDSFYRTMLGRLHVRGVLASPKSVKNGAHLVVHDLRTTRRKLTLGRDALARDIDLFLAVRFSWELIKNGERRRHGPYTVDVRALYEFDDRRYLAGLNELRRIRTGMERRAADRILERLARLS